MKLLQNINKQLNQLKNKIINLFKDQNEQQIEFNKSDSYKYIDDNKDLLRSSLKFSTYAPLIIQSYLWLYGVYAIYTILKTIVLIPIQIVLCLLNFTLKSLKINKIKYLTMQSWIILTVSCIFMLNYDFFDISFMYHLLRGQSTVKVYAIVFALQSCEIVLTKAGVFLHSNIKEKLINKDLSTYKLIPQFCICCIYTFIHTYSIFIQFLIYCVVLNSSMQSFVIFWGVIYLTKMKNSPTFTVDSNKYKQTLTSDSKYRVNRIVYLFLFQISQMQVYIPSIGLKLLFILFFEEGFILIKHMLYLLSNYTGKNDMLAIKVRQDMYKCMYLDTKMSSIDKCVSQNFTVLPSAVFCIKILSIIIYSNWKPNFLAYFTFYLIIILMMVIFILIVVHIKLFEQIALKKSKQQINNALINSLCISLLQNLSKNKSQQHFQLQNNKKQLKLKKVPSIFQSLLLTVNLQNQNKKNISNNFDKQTIQQQQQDSFFIRQKKQKKINKQG